MNSERVLKTKKPDVLNKQLAGWRFKEDAKTNGSQNPVNEAI